MSKEKIISAADLESACHGLYVMAGADPGLTAKGIIDALLWVLLGNERHAELARKWQEQPAVLYRLDLPHTTRPLIDELAKPMPMLQRGAPC